jgi:hypothetical protein
VTISFWCYVAAAVIVLLGGLFFIGAKQTVLDTFRSGNVKHLPDSQLQSAASLLVGVVVVVSVIITALYVLFVLKFRAGRRWARVALAIVAALHLLILIIIVGGSAVSDVGTLAAIVGCVLSFLPRSSAYLASQEQLR